MASVLSPSVRKRGKVAVQWDSHRQCLPLKFWLHESVHSPLRTRPLCQAGTLAPSSSVFCWSIGRGKLGRPTVFMPRLSATSPRLRSHACWETTHSSGHLWEPLLLSSRCFPHESACSGTMCVPVASSASCSLPEVDMDEVKMDHSHGVLIPTLPIPR